jgi:hypothetical protein
MARIPDLVLNSKLHTDLRDGLTVHSYIEQTDSKRKPGLRVEERWVRERIIGHGVYGSIWLESRVKPGDHQVKL